ncbi:hypothetical protein [Empedobacter stercoris]|uniref:hypothetical protein n=1 Tax=Empedobacter stercoris TaxID=1628248 RepID=UPI001CE0BA74|nr:hypothetical protein [Empedobacter stercoris]MCA4775844.1 hypothetical protein [Empedobacter stercoris]
METYIFILVSIAFVCALIPVYTSFRISQLLVSCFGESLKTGLDKLPLNYTKINLRNSAILTVLHIIITCFFINQIILEKNIYITTLFVLDLIIFQFFFFKLIEDSLPVRINEYFKGFKFLKFFKHNFFLLDFSDNKTTNSSENMVSENVLEYVNSAYQNFFNGIIKIKSPFVKSDIDVSKLDFKEICLKYNIDINCIEVVKNKITGTETTYKIIFNGIYNRNYSKEIVVCFFIEYFDIIDINSPKKNIYKNRKQDVLNFINENIDFQNDNAKITSNKFISSKDLNAGIDKYFERK